MEIKRPFQANALISAWASKLGDEGSLSNTGPWYMNLVHSIRLELESLESSLFAPLHLQNGRFDHPPLWQFGILGESMGEFAQHTGCSSCVTDRTLRSHIFLNELWREHPGWTIAHRQEWGLFLLEWPLHYVAFMKKKEHWRHSQRSWGEETEEQAPDHSSMRAQGTLILMRTSRSRKNSQGHSTSLVWSSSRGPWVREATKWPREGSPDGWSGSWKQQSQLRARSRSRWCQSPSPECQRLSSSSSPDP